MKLIPKAKGDFSFNQVFAQATTSKRQNNKQSTGKTDQTQ